MFNAIHKKALQLGASDFGQSARKNKKYYVVYAGKTIHFGYAPMDDFTTHKDPRRQASYRARARGIRNKSGQLTYKLKTSANYWAYNLLW